MFLRRSLKHRLLGSPGYRDLVWFRRRRGIEGAEILLIEAPRPAGSFEEHLLEGARSLLAPHLDAPPGSEWEDIRESCVWADSVRVHEVLEPPAA